MYFTFFQHQIRRWKNFLFVINLKHIDFYNILNIQTYFKHNDV